MRRRQVPFATRRIVRAKTTKTYATAVNPLADGGNKSRCSMPARLLSGAYCEQLVKHTRINSWHAKHTVVAAAGGNVEPASDAADDPEARVEEAEAAAAKARARAMAEVAMKADAELKEKMMKMAAEAKAAEVAKQVEETSKNIPSSAFSHIQKDLGAKAVGYVHKLVGVGLLFFMDTYLEDVFVAASITFPSALAGMFIILVSLLALQAIKPRIVQTIFLVMRPGLEWISRWMPLFYVPTLVILPIALRGIDAASLSKITGIAVVGMIMVLLFTATMTILFRKAFGSIEEGEEEEAGKALFDDKKQFVADMDIDIFVNPPKPALAQDVFIAWSVVWVGSLAAAYLGNVAASVAALPFMLASVVAGFLIGSALPKSVKTILHPLISCFVITDLCAMLFGTVSGVGFESILQGFLTKGAGGVALGAGDYLMRLLGCVILSFGFLIFEQRQLVKANFAEIFGTMTCASLFSLVTTTMAGRALGLSAELTRAIAPRSVTVALALPIGQALGAGAAAPITATTVLLTGLIGAMFAQQILNTLRQKDPVVRGLAAAASSHGLGTAALAASEPKALPFAALAFATMGIMSNVLVAIPPICNLLIALSGAM
eukprot:CAMPEP_0118934178 /NCGR_PEP_ID=MMETSP1169-20130426/13680_1 /TAXON_ID=36882 /ORGANISM="Pyramimonas obovata, Strain CCMP722" /LENGTH=603 /DNA_ID=CAMNT_0006877051 /DNA_START=162 /DNA_END=1973 /DNA_ORIENTATION=-